jgi:hypothetical protein
MSLLLLNYLIQAMYKLPKIVAYYKDESDEQSKEKNYLAKILFELS